MNIHEYQGRELFLQYGIPCPAGIVAESPDAVVTATRQVGYPAVIKAQVLTGGRGKAGGVKLVHNEAEAREQGSRILGMQIKGLTVEKVLVVPAAAIRREFYVGLTVDRTNRALVLMVSASGGVDIEDLAVKNPDAILKVRFNPLTNLDLKAIRPILQQAFVTPALVAQAEDAVAKLYRLFVEKDCSLVEINPYALLDGDKLVALDAKVNIDDNGLVRHPELEVLRNPEESSADERQARRVGLSFVSMDGDIGCIVNGAGLAMATMDLIKHFGGNPANFLDVGGSSNPEKVLNALKIILNNPRVKAILINIFGGITRCDDIAKGILMATNQIQIPVPMVIRLIGTNDREGREILAQAGLTSSENLTEAVQRVVALGKKP
ncbi:MAG: ADP-forming succinate--CoA ligase subunit beta [Lentisphaerae bacterium]|nr:ADP-forming succinate--CoA ligase subunit beta [Lentisphaerota bacterium]